MSSSENAVRALVTGAGAPGIAGTLHALRRNPDQIPVFTLGVDVDANPAGRHLTDAFAEVPRPEDAGYAGKMLELCERYDIGVVVPQTTAETLFFSRQRAAFERKGVAVVVCGDAEAVGRANDKWQLNLLFGALGLPRPDCVLVDRMSELAAAAGQLGYPQRNVVIKPPNSNGMRGLRILAETAGNAESFFADKPDGSRTTLEELARTLGPGPFPSLMVCSLLPGEEYSVDIFADDERLVCVPRKRLRIRSGISFHTRIDLRADIEEIVRPVVRELRLAGVFGFQFKLDAEGRPAILECNPRIQGTMVASMAAGVNVIWMGVCHALKIPYRAPPQLRDGGEFLRYWGGVLVNESGAEPI
jgi:carbamoyl-phosphate synthase large subunit